MRPQWYNINRLPFKKMWPDDIIWFPYMMRGAKFYGYITFQGMDTIVNHKIEEVSCLNSLKIPAGPHEGPDKRQTQDK